MQHKFHQMDWFKWLSSSNLDPSLVHQYGVVFTQNQLQYDDIPFFNHEFLQSMGITVAKHRLEILKLLSPPPTKHHHHHHKSSSNKVLVVAKKTKNSFTKYMLKTFGQRHSQSQSQSQNNVLAIVPVYDESNGRVDYDQQGSRLSKGLTMLKRTSQKKYQPPNKSASTTPESYYTTKKQYQQKSMRYGDQNAMNMNTKTCVNGSCHRRVVSFTTATNPFEKDCLKMVDNMNGHYETDYDHDHHGQDHGDEFDFDDGYWSAGVEETKWDSLFHNLKPN